MNKKIAVPIIICIFIVTVAVVLIFYRPKSVTPVINMEKTTDQNIQTEFGTVTVKGNDAKAVTSDLNLINDDDFSDASLSDYNVGL
jgi:hypothetical protein